VADLVGFGAQWELRKEAALSAIVEQQKDKEAVEAENAANNAKLLENIAHVRKPSTCTIAIRRCFCQHA
jgi:hypothetical protein